MSNILQSHTVVAIERCMDFCRAACTGNPYPYIMGSQGSIFFFFNHYFWATLKSLNWYLFLLELPVVNILHKSVQLHAVATCKWIIFDGWHRWLSTVDYQQIITSLPQTWKHFFKLVSYWDIDLWPFVQWGNDQPRSLLVLITNADSNPWHTKGQNSLRRDSTLVWRCLKKTSSIHLMIGSWLK